MAQQSQHTLIEQVLELLSEQGTDGFLAALSILLSAAMCFEHEHFLQAAPYEGTRSAATLPRASSPSACVPTWVNSTCASHRCIRVTSTHKRPGPAKL